MSSSQVPPSSVPLSWSEKRAIYLSQSQNDHYRPSQPAVESHRIQDQASTSTPLQSQPPAIPPRLQGADDPNFLNRELANSIGINGLPSGNPAQSLFPGSQSNSPIPPRRGSSTSITSSSDSQDPSFSRKNLIMQAVSSGATSTSSISSSQPHHQPSDSTLAMPTTAISTPLPTSSGKSSPLPSSSRGTSPIPSMNSSTPTASSKALPPFSNATTSSPYLNARTQAMGQSSGNSTERGSSPYGDRISKASTSSLNQVQPTSSIGLAKYLASQPNNSNSNASPASSINPFNRLNQQEPNGYAGRMSSNYEPSFRSSNSDSIASSPNRFRSSTNPSTSSFGNHHYQEIAPPPPPRKKEKKSFLMDSDFNLEPNVSSTKDKEREREKLLERERERQKKLKRQKPPENERRGGGGIGIDSEQSWSNGPSASTSNSGGGVVNALGHFGGLVGKKGWDFVKGLNGPTSPSLGGPASSSSSSYNYNNNQVLSDPISSSQHRSSNSRSQSPLPPPPSHPNRGQVGQTANLGHGSSQSLSLGQMSGVAFNALKRSAGVATGSNEYGRASQDLKRSSISSFELNDATRKWLAAPEPPIAGGVGPRTVGTTGRARGKSSSTSTFSATTGGDGKGVFGMELRDAVLRTRLGRPSNDDLNQNSDLRNLDLDLDLGNEFGLSDSEVLKISSANHSNPNSRRSSTTNQFPPSPHPKPKRLSSNKIIKTSGERQPYTREEARIRCLPAIVTRCLESLEKFGKTEEGIYRLSGRSSHTNKLRGIFDVPVSAPSSHSTSVRPPGKSKSKSISRDFILPDLELSEIGPAELDLNSVCSVLKSYLRDLPEPLLGKDLVKEFDEKCLKVTGRVASGGTLGMGLAGQNPTSLTATNSNSTGNSTGGGGKDEDPEVQAARQIEKLANEVEPLMKRIPCQNWYLLREIAIHLMDMTREDVVQVTKMPLSNLCLVLAPTLSLSGVLLRALVIHNERLFSIAPPADETIDGPIVGWTSTSSTTPEAATSNLTPTGMASMSMEDRRGSTMTVRPRSNTQPQFSTTPTTSPNYQFSFGLSNNNPNSGPDSDPIQIISGSGRSSPSGMVIPPSSLNNSSRSASPWTLASVPSSSEEDLNSNSEPKIARRFIKTSQGGLMNTASSASLSSNPSENGNGSGSNFSHSDQSHQSLTNSTSHPNSIDQVDDASSSISSHHDAPKREAPIIPNKPPISALDRPRPPTRGSFYSSFSGPVIPTRSRRRNNAADSDTSGPPSSASSPIIESGFGNQQNISSAGITLLGNSSSNFDTESRNKDRNPGSTRLELDFQSLKLGDFNGVNGEEENLVGVEERRKMWEGK